MLNEEKEWLDEMSRHYDTTDPMWQTSLTVSEGDNSVTAEQFKLKDGNFEVRCEYRIKVGEETKILKTKTAYPERLEAPQLTKLLHNKINKQAESTT